MISFLYRYVNFISSISFYFGRDLALFLLTRNDCYDFSQDSIDLQELVLSIAIVASEQTGSTAVAAETLRAISAESAEAATRSSAVAMLKTDVNNVQTIKGDKGAQGLEGVIGIAGKFLTSHSLLTC